MTTQLAINQIRTDGGTQPRAQLDFTIVGEYAEAMADGAHFPPVVVFYDGADHWLADGFHRLQAAQQSGSTTIAADVRQGSLEDARWHSYGVNQTHGLRRTNEDKRRAVEAALAHPFNSRYSNREIARHCGVSSTFVDNVRCELSANGLQIDAPRLVTRNGTTYEMQTANIGDRAQAVIREIHGKVEAGDLRPMTAAAIVDALQRDPGNVDGILRSVGEYAASMPFVPGTADYADPYGDDEVWPTTAAQPLVSHQLINASTNNEWYTPAPFIEAAREVMGRIDLDPASCEFANRTVRALVFYSQEDDGLSSEWHGNVWLNPPYGRDEGESNQAVWSRRLMDEYAAGRVRQAILLVNAVPGNSWFVPLKRFPICFPDARIRFYNEDTEAGQPTHSNALIYFGPNRDRFEEVFSQFGAVMGVRSVWA